MMVQSMKWFIIASVFCALAGPAAHAQTVTTASCNSGDLLKALNSVVQTTATVIVPSGTCNWTSDLAFTVPSGTTSLTIQGATTCTGSGDPASNNLSCVDGTILVDNDTTDTSYLLEISTTNASQFVRITGLTFEEGSNTLENDGILTVYNAGGGQSVHIDHNHFDGDTFSGSIPDANLVYVGGCTFGLVDHNIFTMTGTERGDGIFVYNGETCGDGQNGDGSFAVATGFGTNQMLYMEQNLFYYLHNAGTSAEANDCVLGGRQVFRFNTLYNGAHLETHPTGNAGSQRGCRATEIYGNEWIFNTSTSSPVNTLFFFSSGPALIWGNRSPNQGYDGFVQLEDCRSPSGTTRCGYTESTPPAGWGYCGSSSVWDGNTNGSGYPCIDQPGRGQSDLLSGSFASSNREDTVTGTQTWPNQKLEPIYYWLNYYNAFTNGNDTGPVSTNGSIWTQNTDYYISSDPNSSSDCNGFTGTTGVGCGPLSGRPSTCTLGVGYWATDQGSWNQSGNGSGEGELFVCSATNTWSLYYAPFTYPHPLTTGSQSSGGPSPPSNLSAVAH